MVTAAGARETTASVRVRTTPPALLVAPVCGAPALVLMVVLLAVGLPIVVAIVVPVLLAVALGAWLLSTREAAVIGGLAMRPATEADQPRLFNMVDGLCDSHGFRRPTLLVIDDDARNALVYGRGPEHATLAVTRGWLASLSRMGLEGLLARELARCNDPGLATATTAASVARVLPGGLRTRVVRGVMGEHRVVLDDLDAVRFTRYPPGLAAALATQLDGTAIVAAAPRAGHHLWVTSPGPGSSILGDTPPVDLRIDALREL